MMWCVVIESHDMTLLNVVERSWIHKQKASQNIQYRRTNESFHWQQEIEQKSKSKDDDVRENVLNVTGKQKAGHRRMNKSISLLD